MAQLPTPIPLLSQSSIASYAYTDISSGSGATRFYATIFVNYSGAADVVTYALVDTALKASTGAATAGQPPKIEMGSSSAEFDFDTGELNKPMIVRGICYISCFLNFTDNGIRMSAQLYKWDGSNETVISDEVETAASASTSSRSELFKLTCAQTNIKKGEVIRLKLRGKQDDSGNPFQPDNQGTSTYLPCTVDIPQKLDL